MCESKAIVLLSGLDSCAALHWARETFDTVSAVSFWYGQPHAAAEIAASQAVAHRRGIPWGSIHLAEAVRGLTTISPPIPGVDTSGVSRANLPARNAILLSVAAAHAARSWPREEISLVIGANADDARAFPDCRKDFFVVAERTLKAALAGVANPRIRAPWIEQNLDKCAIVKWAAARPLALIDVRMSVSCYRGTRCGLCDACSLRAHAFSEAGIEDGLDVVSFHGGDPHRERR